MGVFVSSRGYCLTVLCRASLGCWHPCPVQIPPPTCSQMRQEWVLVSQGTVPEQVNPSQPSYRCVCSREEGKKAQIHCRSQGFLLMGNSPKVPGKEGEMIRCVSWVRTSRHSLRSCSMLLAEPGLKNVVPCSQLEPFGHSALTAPASLMAHHPQWETPESWLGSCPRTETCAKVERSYNTHYLGTYKHTQMHPGLIPPEFSRVHHP